MTNINGIYPWQMTQWCQLTQQVQRQCLPHALLLTGQSGLGKLKFAKQFAQYVLCTHRAKEQCCGTCQSCHWYRVESHPDLLYLQPEDEGKRIKVSHVRQLITDLAQTAKSLAGYQVVIVQPADAMNMAAANALLKTLEEPPGQVCLLLITNQPEHLPATIRSRCQQIAFAAKPHEAKLWLQQQQLNNEVIDLVLSLANGSPLNALQWYNEEQLAQREQWFNDLFAVVIEQQQTPVSIANKWSQQNIKMLCQWYLTVLLDLLRLHFTQQSHYITNFDQLNMLQQISQHYPLEKLLHQLDNALFAVRWVDNPVNLNKTLLLEKLLAGWVCRWTMRHLD